MLKLKPRFLVLTRNCLSDEYRYFKHTAPLFNHGAGPIPGGVENRETTQYVRTVPRRETMAMIAAAGYLIVKTTENASGLPTRLPLLYGVDLLCQHSPTATTKGLGHYPLSNTVGR